MREQLQVGDQVEILDDQLYHYEYPDEEDPYFENYCLGLEVEQEEIHKMADGRYLQSTESSFTLYFPMGTRLQIVDRDGQGAFYFHVINNPALNVYNDLFNITLVTDKRDYEQHGFMLLVRKLKDQVA